TFTVHPGDTLWGVATRYGMSTSSLARINGIADPNLILPGEVIHLTGSPSSADPGAGFLVG
ncbi:MAG: LysM peptidoglycan-binding domain-containing protein, partial [Acidimicrobiales bacterium]